MYVFLVCISVRLSKPISKHSMGVQCHNIFYRDEIRVDQKYGTEIGLGIHYDSLLTIPFG